ncbi:glycosyltransferase family 9 protein [bacterium]|nr:glycosyltransferase family 9 protein [bacterium]
MKVLVARTDRLGDLVLSLPVLADLKAALPAAQVHAMVAPGAVPLVEHDPAVTRVWTWHDALSAADTDALAEALRAEGFAAAVLLQYRRELATLLRRAGVPRRYGPLSKWSSWWLLNRGARQGRSRRARHEMDYNRDLGRRLARDLGAAAAVPAGGPRLHLGPAQREAAAAFRAAHGTAGRRIVFVHPGSGGSALDWEPARFAAVANALAADGHFVAITGAGADGAVVERVAAGLAPGVAVLLDAFDLRGFLAVLAAGDLFIGPSTGPLHMAAALGVATIGLFPPVRTMHPDRWGPRGAGGDAGANLVPPVDCPARRVCRGERCPHHNCMDAIAVADVVAAARPRLAPTAPSDRKNGEAR